MFGFIIGTLSLIGLIKLARGGGRWGGRGYGRRGGWMLRGLFERLSTSPGQERVISDAFETLQHKGYALKDELFKSRSDVANAMKGEHFDAETVRAAFDKQQAAFEELKKEAIGQFQKVHEALEPEQRQRLAQLLEYGPRAFHGGGCGHSRWHGHGRFASAGPGSVNL